MHAWTNTEQEYKTNDHSSREQNVRFYRRYCISSVGKRQQTSWREVTFTWCYLKETSLQVVATAITLKIAFLRELETCKVNFLFALQFCKDNWFFYIICKLPGSTREFMFDLIFGGNQGPAKTTSNRCKCKMTFFIVQLAKSAGQILQVATANKMELPFTNLSDCSTVIYYIAEAEILGFCSYTCKQILWHNDNDAVELFFFKALRPSAPVPSPEEE